MTKLLKDPTEVKTDPAQLDVDRTYIALGKSTEYWIALGRGAFVFRFGPYTGKEAGAILNRAVEERIAVTVVGQCSKEFDWEIAKDMGMTLVLPGDRKSIWRRMINAVKHIFITANTASARMDSAPGTPKANEVSG